MKYPQRLKSILSNALVVGLMIQSLSSVTFAQAARPSDLITSPGDRGALQQSFGENWEQLVNSDPERFSTGQNRGFLPKDWKEKVSANTESQATASATTATSFSSDLKPSDLIVYPVDIKVLKDNFGENWADVVNKDPERFKSFLPKDWKDKVSSDSIPKNEKKVVADSETSQDTSQSNNEMPKSDVGTKKDEGAKVSIANQILALGTGIIGANILTSCSLGSSSPSLVTFMAGSLAYIGSEIAGAKAQKAFIKSKKDEIEALKAQMTEGGDLQKEIIEVKLKEEEEKLAFVKKRKTWTTAVTAMYTAATGLAVMEKICVSNPASLPTCTQWVMAGCNGASSLPSSKLLSTAVLAAYGYGVGSAGGGMVSTVGSTGYALYLALGDSVSMLNGAVSAAYSEPGARVITFGVGAALAAAVMIDLNKIQDELEGNIADLKKLLADFNSKTEASGGLEEGGETVGAGGGNIGDINHNISSAAGNLNKLSNGTSIEKSCWGKDASGLQSYSPSACNKSLQLTKPKYNSKFSLPTLQKVANTGVDMAQAVARGDMARADLAAADLASNAMKVKDITDNLMKQLNDQNKKSGKNGIDLEAEIQKSIGNMRKGLNNRMGSQGVNLADFGSGTKASLDKKNPSLFEQDIKKDSSAAILDPSAKGAGFDITEASGDELIDANSQTASGEEVATHTIDDFETAEADILDRPDTSIFKQVSNRYFLNYSKFFNSEPKKGVEGTPVKQTK